MLAGLIVSAFLSNGITCSRPPVATTSATTPRFNFSLCINTDAPLCGISYRFAPVNTAGATLRINSRVQNPAFGDPIRATAFPVSLFDAATLDLGALGKLPPGSYLVATYNVSILGSKPATNYSFALAPVSAIAVDAAGSCGALIGGKGANRFDPISIPGDAPIAGSFTVKKK